MHSETQYTKNGLHASETHRYVYCAVCAHKLGADAKHYNILNGAKC